VDQDETGSGHFPGHEGLSEVTGASAGRRTGGGVPGDLSSGDGPCGVWLFLGLSLISGLPGCFLLSPHETPSWVTRWQDPSPPRLSLREKARAYQEKIEAFHMTAEGLLRYERRLEDPGDGSYGDLADGPFHTGIYLASQAFRHATTHDPAARAEVLLALNGLRMLMEVTGKKGLLARYFTPLVPTRAQPAGNAGVQATGDREEDLRQKPRRQIAWARSRTHPEYLWRGDASKDQYAGFVHGLGVTLALLPDPEVRSLIGELSAAAADHIMENGLQIVDVDGRRTKHGDLSGRILFIPIGVNALISLALTRVAAESTQQPRYERFYRELVEDGYPGLSYWAHFDFLGVGNRVNDNMAYLALCPVLLLEKDGEVLGELRRAGRRSWRAVAEDRNAFFSFVHAGLVQPGAAAAQESGRTALREYPDDKVEWPVDLTRPEFQFPRASLNTRKGVPRTTRGVPLYLRPRSSCFWASDPFRLVGNLTAQGDTETAGADYLLAYWMGRYFGFIGAEE